MTFCLEKIEFLRLVKLGSTAVSINVRSAQTTLPYFYNKKVFSFSFFVWLGYVIFGTLKPRKVKAGLGREVRQRKKYPTVSLPHYLIRTEGKTQMLVE